MSRLVRIALTADQPDALAYKRDFLVRCGYSVIERTFEDMPGLEATKVFVPTRYEPEWVDLLSRIHVRQLGDTVYYHEEFSTDLLMKEVEASELRKDHPTAKVLLADTHIDFLTILPGRVTTALAGDFSQDSIAWSYDVERLFANKSFVMSAQSSVARQEELSWILLAVSLLVTTVGVLILAKGVLRRKTA